MRSIKRWFGWTIVMGIMRALLDQNSKLQGLLDRCSSWFSNPHYEALMFVVITFIVSGLFMSKH
jgi:hypothetical protein